MLSEKRFCRHNWIDTTAVEHQNLAMSDSVEHQQNFFRTCKICGASEESPFENFRVTGRDVKDERKAA